ncbi:hypothetical protein Pan44_02910 [Caulifigura coniformis]|uniref:Putative zinc-finger domain-containing protein n=1 Tax=Caulifigura coniformis TaxID=2527983 RepID=A0A517S845_9PLAN|nr:zf-HC2 domain-containing protein [Caulifigura coniformis]QDT52282.1 hypothetical protein Pan44_02910 [Caulifigura coniformis]
MSRDFDELLSAYLDGEVSPEERAAVERRLEQSPGLRETLDELSEVGDLIRGLPRARAPVDLPERVVAAIAPKPLVRNVETKRRRLFGMWPVMAAGSVLAAGVAIVVLLPGEVAKGRRVVTGDELVNSGGVPEGFAITPAPVVPPVELGFTTPNGRGVNSAHVQSLTDYVQKLGRDPLPGEVLSTLYGNAGQTQVLKYTVVDTRKMAGTMKTILTDNSFDIVVTETPALAGGTSAATSGGRQLVYYVEGTPEQIGQTLDAIETLPDFREFQDLGTLAVDSEAESANSFGAQAGLAASKPADESGLQESFGRPVAAPKSEAAGAAAAGQLFAAPEDLSSAAAKSRWADRQATNESEKDFSKLAESKPASDPKELPSAPPAPAAPSEPMVTTSEPVATTPALTTPESAPAQVSNGRGVSAQIDSQAAMPIVETMLRNRSQGNGVQGNSLKGNGLQRGLAGQNQTWNVRRSRSNGVVQENAAGNVAASPRNEVERSNEAKSSLGISLKQQQSAAEPVSQNFDVTDQAAIVNARNGASQEQRVHALIILELAPAQPAVAVPAVPAAPADKKKASN